MIDRQLPIEPVKLITGHAAPIECPFCKSPRWMIEGHRVSFTCHTTSIVPRQLACEKINPKVKQTLKCIALAKAGEWKRAAA